MSKKSYVVWITLSLIAWLTMFVGIYLRNKTFKNLTKPKQCDIIGIKEDKCRKY